MTIRRNKGRVIATTRRLALRYPEINRSRLPAIRENAGNKTATMGPERLLSG